MITASWTRPAVNDLTHLRQYIADRDPRAANKVASSILAAIVKLRHVPAAGRPGRIAGTRELVVVDAPYIVAYRVRDGILEVLRVMHTARRWPTKLP